MPQAFTEENTTGEIIQFNKDNEEYGEQEGIKWGDITKAAKKVINTSISNIQSIFEKQQRETQQRIREQQERERREREQRERERREREERERRERETREREERERRERERRIRDMGIQIQQLFTRINQLETIITSKNEIINQKNKEILFFTNENIRLRKKVNSILDNLQYYKTAVLGTDKIEGYRKTIVNQQLKIDELLQSEIGKPITQIKDSFESFLNNKINDMEIQIRQLSTRVSELENIIRDKDILIDKKNKHIAFLTSENTRLRKKVNSLLDNLQYYKTSVLGTDEVDGYKTTVVKQQLKIDELLQQEIGKPITAAKDGFENIYEGFEYDFAKILGSGAIASETNENSTATQRDPDIFVDSSHIFRSFTKENEGYRKNSGLLSSNDYDNYDSLKNEHIILEGYVDQAMASYNAVFIENQSIQNHNDNTTNVYSINNQLTLNIIAKQNTLKFVNYILIIVFFIVYLYGCYKVYTIDGMENYIKLAICIVMFFTIFILHTIEYIIFTILPLFIAFIVKTPIRPSKYFKGPSFYDYFPKISLSESFHDQILMSRRIEKNPIE